MCAQQAMTEVFRARHTQDLENYMETKFKTTLQPKDIEERRVFTDFSLEQLVFYCFNPGEKRQELLSLDDTDESMKTIKRQLYAVFMADVLPMGHWDTEKIELVRTLRENYEVLLLTLALLFILRG